MNNDISIKRKLSAIVVTDIVGFTSLSGRDEVYSIEILNKQRTIITPLVSKYNGKLQKEIGDGLLLTFDTVTDAIRFSIDFQNSAKDIDNLNLRIGIHEGEINFITNDIIGDDVNITYRIESFSPEGGVAISDKVQRDISSLTEFETEYIGIPDLKGVSKDVEVHCIISHGLNKSKQKIKSKSKILTASVVGFAVIFISIMIFPFLKADNEHESLNDFFQYYEKLESTDHNKEILYNFNRIDSLLTLNNLESNFEAFNIIDELIILNPNESDFYSLKGKVLYQRYILEEKIELLENTIKSLKKALELNNSNKNILVGSYVILAEIEYKSNNIAQAYQYSKNAFRINKFYPALREIHKKINKKRLST